MPKDRDSRLKESTNEERKDRRAEGHFKSLNGSDDTAERKFFGDMFNKFRNLITPDELDGIERYTGSSYYTMNGYLRNGKFGSGDDSWTEEKIKNATSGLSKFSLDKDITVYRKSDDSLFNKIIFSQLGINLGYGSSGRSQFIKDVNSMIGSVVRDKGFTSTSTQQRVWDGDIHMEIRVPKGTNGAWVKPISSHSSEREFILNRGTYFKIVGAREYKDPKTGAMKPMVTLQVVRSSRHTRKKLGKKT